MQASTSQPAVARPQPDEFPQRFAGGTSLPAGVYRGRTTAEPLRRLPHGLPWLDAVLGGGWPCGRISEICGPPSSGKTSLGLALLAAATRRGELAACIDVDDALHPRCAAASGVDLQRLLWVRPPALRAALRCTELVLRSGGFTLVVLDLGLQSARVPPPAWLRLLRAAEHARSAFVVLALRRVAGSFAFLSLRVQPRRVRWQPGAWPLLDGFASSVRLERNKLGVLRATEIEVQGAGGAASPRDCGAPPARGRLGNET